MSSLDCSTLSQEALWGLIMKMADPSDLLRTILNSAAERQSTRVGQEHSMFRNQTLVLTDCTVTIHQHGAPPLAPEPTVGVV
jgi:hypothetical protein